jgi:metal-responsive CopG/Arc/MetJ family transcriptional regulator
MKVPVSIRIEAKLLEWIDEQAKKDNRNRNNFIEWAMMLHRSRVLAEDDDNFS